MEAYVKHHKSLISKEKGKKGKLTKTPSSPGPAVSSVPSVPSVSFPSFSISEIDDRIMNHILQFIYRGILEFRIFNFRYLLSYFFFFFNVLILGTLSLTLIS